MYNTKTQSRLQEMIEGSFIDSDNVKYTVDRNGCMIRVERARPQVTAAHQSLSNTTKEYQ